MRSFFYVPVLAPSFAWHTRRLGSCDFTVVCGRLKRNASSLSCSWRDGTAYSSSHKSARNISPYSGWPGHGSKPLRLQCRSRYMSEASFRQDTLPPTLYRVDVHHSQYILRPASWHLAGCEKYSNEQQLTRPSGLLIRSHLFGVLVS